MYDFLDRLDEVGLEHLCPTCDTVMDILGLRVRTLWWMKHFPDEVDHPISMENSVAHLDEDIDAMIRKLRNHFDSPALEPPPEISLNFFQKLSENR
jgi:hypothetical protein